MKPKQSNPAPALPLSGEGAKTNTFVQKAARSAPPPDKGEAGRGLKQPRLHNLKHQETKRRQLRKTPTEPEKCFWSWVRGKQLGTKFRRQHGIGSYIVDFYCAEYKLIVELDGDSHFTPEAIAYDDTRTNFINSKDFSVLRFTNQDVMNNKSGVLMTLTHYLEQRNGNE